MKNEKNRPLKVKSTSLTAAQTVLNRSYRFKEKEEFKQMYIRRNMSEEERGKIQELVTEGKRKKLRKMRRRQRKAFLESKVRQTT